MVPIPRGIDWKAEKLTIQRMSDDEIAGLEEEIRSARYHLEGALSMVQDPYARGNLHRYLDQLVHSANKWLDHCIEAMGDNGAVPTVTPKLEPSQVSGATLDSESAKS